MVHNQGGITWIRYLVKLKNGTVEVTSNDYPLFLYENEEYHEDDPYLGLCRGPFLVKVGWHFITFHCILNYYLY